MPSRGSPCMKLLRMSTKAVTMRATTATRAGCVQCGLGRETPGARLDSSRAAAEDDPRPSILLRNTKGFIANKISIIEQIAYKNKAFIIVLQETHCKTCRQTSDLQLLTSWVSPEQEPRPCHVCPWAFGMVTGRSVSRTIRDSGCA